MKIDGLQVYPIPNFPGYSITKTGEVWSEKSHMWLKISLNKSTNYNEVSLYCNHRVRPVHIHRLVLETFVGPCPAGLECRHLDSNRLNNYLENLKWGTGRENISDRIRKT